MDETGFALTDKQTLHEAGLHPMDECLPAADHAARSSTLGNNPKNKPMAKKSRGGRMTAAKRRAAKSPGGKGPVAKRPAGLRIMRT
jgi:hypothetical protein